MPEPASSGDHRWEHFASPIRWTFTETGTSPLALDCQNVDVRVSFDEFRNIFDEALAA